MMLQSKVCKFHFFFYNLIAFITETFFKPQNSDATFLSAMSEFGESLESWNIRCIWLEKSAKKSVCAASSVNEVRYRRLSKGAEAHEIPPTQDALFLLVQRASYRHHIWKDSLDAKI